MSIISSINICSMIEGSSMSVIKLRGTVASFRSVAITATIALIALFSAPEVAAQEVSPEEYEAFEAHVLRSGELLNQSEFEEAISELQAAREIIDHPRISIRVAQAYMDWSRCEKADEEFAQLLGREDIDDDTRTSISESRDALTDCVTLSPLRVRCNPPTATVRVRGVGVDEVLTCPISQDFPVGEYQLHVSAEGYHPGAFPAEVDPDDGSTTAVALAAAPEPVGPQDEPEAVAMMDYAGYAALGVGTAMVLGGAILDSRAGNRASEIAQARDAADWTRVDELEAAGSSARNTTLFLYIGGAAFITTGAILTFVDFDSTPDDDLGAGLRWQVSPTGVAAHFRW